MRHGQFGFLLWQPQPRRRRWRRSQIWRQQRGRGPQGKGPLQGAAIKGQVQGQQLLYALPGAEASQRVILI